MRIALIGGQLQGLEAVYLTKKAGFESILVDRDPRVPAKALADEFHCADLIKNGAEINQILKGCDLILPATESKETLMYLKKAGQELDIPVALDLHAYSISSSKNASNRLFEENAIPMPEPWPDCGYPVIIKPSHMSGSEGVVKANTPSQVEEVLGSMGDEPVIQKYAEGPSYSLEVIGHRGECACFQVTLLEFDAEYDCKRVIAGPKTGANIEEAFRDIAARIAGALRLSGIMDIEVIHTVRGLEVLEIDARLPSQTPIAVFHSSGVNMLQLLCRYWIGGEVPRSEIKGNQCSAAIFEHYRFKDRTLKTAGEHILRSAQGLALKEGLFSSSMFLSNFEDHPNDWVATAVYTGQREEEAWENRSSGIEALLKEFQVRSFEDPEPAL